MQSLERSEPILRDSPEEAVYGIALDFFEI